MKNLIIILGACTLLMACSSGKGGDKQAQLDKLKKQEAEISEQIKTLEKEIAAEGKGSDSSKSKMVAVTAVETKPFKHYVEIQGRIDAIENINVSPKMAGLVTKVNVKEGDEVHAGSVLAEIDDQLIKQNMEELKSSLSLSTTVYEKQKSLWDRKIGSEIQYLTAKNQKETLERKLETLEEQLDMCKIKAPFNGTVDMVSLRVGQSVAPGMPSIRVVNLSKLKAKADVAEAYASKVKVGNDVVVVFPDLNKEIKATISFVGEVIDPLNRTFSVEVKLEGNVPDYHPNMIVVLKVIDYKKDSALVVPINVVQNSEEGKYLFLAVNENGKTVAKKQMVSVGLSYDGKTEITNGLSASDQVITTGFQDLNNGEFLKF
jgi:membrane fusion protein (multidrug efflux system)